MPVQPFEASLRSMPNLAIIDLHGDIDGFAEDMLEKTYTDAEALNPEAILLNFSDVEYINSTGIALIVGLLAKSRKSNRRLITIGLSDHYVEIFRITRLADFISIFSDEEMALKAIQSPG
jgi:anti-anti-sigma factor